MTTFKKGQRVWWDDPICEKSGEYEVLDSQDEINAGKPENERIIRIGGGESTWDVPADYLTIVCPISDEDRQQLKQQEYRIIAKTKCTTSQNETYNLGHFPPDHVFSNAN